MATLYNKQITGAPDALLDSLPEWTLLEPGPVMAIDASGTGVVKTSGSGSSVYELGLAHVPADVRVTFTTLSGYGGIIGVILRCSGDANRNGYLVRIDKSNNKRLQIHTITGTATFKKQKEYTQTSMVPADPQTVTVEVQGHTVRIWTANEPYVLEWSDPDKLFSGGSIGFYFYGATLDTVKVESLEPVTSPVVTGALATICEDTTGTSQGAIVPPVVTGLSTATCAGTTGSVLGVVSLPVVQGVVAERCEETAGNASGVIGIPTDLLVAAASSCGAVLGSYLTGSVPFSGDSWAIHTCTAQTNSQATGDGKARYIGDAAALAPGIAETAVVRLRSSSGLACAQADVFSRGGRAITARLLPVRSEPTGNLFPHTVLSGARKVQSSSGQHTMGLRLLYGAGVPIHFSEGDTEDSAEAITFSTLPAQPPVIQFIRLSGENT